MARSLTERARNVLARADKRQSGTGEAAALSVTVRQPVDALQSAAPLPADGCLEGNPFFAARFVAAAAACIGGAPVEVADVVDDSGEVQARAAATRIRLGHLAPATRLWSHPYGPCGTPLLRTGNAAAALEALADAWQPGGTLVVPHIDLDGPVAALLAAFAHRAGRPTGIVGEYPRPVARRTAWQGEAGMSPHRRSELRRQARLLAETGTVTWSTATEPRMVRHRFAQFLELEASGWKGRAGTALASRIATAQFARKAIFAAERDDEIRIDSIDLDGRPAAMAVSLVAGRALFVWKIAYREELRHFAPGVQLLGGLPGHAFGDSRCDLIDSCTQVPNAMPVGMWPESRRIGTLAVGPAGSLSGAAFFRLGLAVARAEAEAIARAKRARRRVAA